MRPFSPKVAFAQHTPLRSIECCSVAKAYSFSPVGFIAAVAAFGALSLSEPSHAQSRPVLPSPAPPAASFPTARTPVDSAYVVGPDDVLTVTVMKHPEFGATQLIVPQNGLITLPVIGTIRATGKSLQQLDRDITRGMLSRLKFPDVTVTLEKPRPRPIYVVGQVKNPGMYEVKNGWRVTEVLAIAGGLSVDSDLASVIVSRANRKLIDTPLLPLLKNPTIGSNIALRTGDSVRFYERKVTVSVTGAVSKPGIYSVPLGSGIAEAVGIAGGSLTNAALTKATVRRATGQIVPVNLYKAIRQNDTVSNLRLVEGDVVVVPEQKDRISVLGAVEKPGFFPMEDGRDLRVADAVALAGGPKTNAALTRALVRHGNGSQQTIDLYRVLVLGDQTGNISLAPDDLLSIPQAAGVTVLGEVTTPGSYPLEEGKKPRVSDAIAAAGGLKIKPELARISVARTDATGTLTSVNLNPVGLLELSDLSQNRLLQDGDIVSISAIKRTTIFVSGEVKLPGAYELAEGDGVAELIARAGGSTPDAALTQVAVTRRDGTVSTVNTASALLEGGTRAGGPLRDGDVVVVPRSKRRVLVVGAVNKPGSYAMPEDQTLTVGDALSLAGGPQNNSKTIELLRPTSPDGQKVTRTVLQVNKVNKGVLAINQPLLVGDVIYVPEGKPKRSTLDTIASFLPAAVWLF